MRSQTAYSSRDRMVSQSLSKVPLAEHSLLAHEMKSEMYNKVLCVRFSKRRGQKESIQIQATYAFDL